MQNHIQKSKLCIQAIWESWILFQYGVSYIDKDFVFYVIALYRNYIVFSYTVTTVCICGLKDTGHAYKHSSK
jgi:hypothetical protein